MNYLKYGTKDIGVASGGALDLGEKPLDALKIELQEELEFAITSAKNIMCLQFDLTPAGLDSCFRDYFIIEPSIDKLKKIKLHEGRMYKAWGGSDLGNLKLKPHDAFALHLFFD
jgi:hypothetical protein